jgi:hypothetical protein
VCPDDRIRDRIWEELLQDRVYAAYTRAIDQARFLLRVERDGKPTTYNHYFNSEMQQRRLDRIDATIETQASKNDAEKVTLLPAATLSSLVVDEGNVDQACEDILDILVSYYKVSRKRFVDAVCMQVIGHFLLDGEESPLRVFSPEMVMRLDDGQLEAIAGEDEDIKQRRDVLDGEIQSLEAALKVLRA